GDKSISHRYAILAALAEGRSEIHNFSPAADCHSTLECLRRLGIAVEAGKDRVTIEGRGLRGLKAPRKKLDAENSGTTMRLLAGVLAGQSFSSTLTGDASLRRRPMRRVIEPLREMGAAIRASDGDCAPLEITGAPLKPIDYSLPVPSAQVKSAILLAGLYASGATSVTEPVRTRDHTELALAEFGADVRTNGATVCLAGLPAAGLQARQLIVPGDVSSAVFFLAAALILPGSSLLITGCGLNPTRTAVLDVLATMGAPISLSNVSMRHGELVGDISIRYAALAGGMISGLLVAQLIDELPMLVALAPFTEQGIEIRDAAELRVKESDRIATLAENLRRMGARVEESKDGLKVAGKSAGKLRGAEIDPRGDHRMAMAFAIAALGAEGNSVIRDSDCAAVSYPEFFPTLQKQLDR
ncbi:MAG TPA: 3-phosphoshikimate 1-carboxyvinyltransferase, partial [Candidatus Acidoferrales bacterium]|nr:3-phosphoshikimate 1-carboxyvinyltransferase [Candidatus Acidoferrales bacterium]